MPNQGSGYKNVLLYSLSCNGTASYTYPTAFTYTPQILSQSLTALVTSISTTSVTFTGTGTSGWIELNGY